MFDTPEDIVSVHDAITIVSPLIQHRGRAVKLATETIIQYSGRYRAYQIIGNQTFFVLLVGARTLLLNTRYVQHARRVDGERAFTRGCDVTLALRLPMTVKGRYTGRFESYWLVGGKTFLSFRQGAVSSWVALDAIPVIALHEGR